MLKYEPVKWRKLERWREPEIWRTGEEEITQKMAGMKGVPPRTEAMAGPKGDEGLRRE